MRYLLFPPLNIILYHLFNLYKKIELKSALVMHSLYLAYAKFKMPLLLSNYFVAGIFNNEGHKKSLKKRDYPQCIFNIRVT